MSDAPKLAFDFAAVTDIGCERSNNEDSYGYDSEQQIYVVCDGMGGSAAGEVASSLAVRSLIRAFGSTAGQGEDGTEMPVEHRLHAAIRETNRLVHEASRSDPTLENMGTTLVCACLEGDRAVIGNVGDSRAYLVRNGVCAQVTVDHSLIQEAMRAGDLTAELAALPGVQSVITRAVGVADSVELDLFAAQVLRRDVILLASDGLTRYVTEQEIASLLPEDASLSDSCRTMVETAKQRGGADNITCMLLRAVDTPAEAAPRRDRPEGNSEREKTSDSTKAFMPSI